jgi:hypothetical protein
MTLICYDDNGDKYSFECADGFVSRVVSAIFHSDQIGCYSDARRVMEIMNAAAEREARALIASQSVVEPRTAAGSLD